MFDSKDIIMQFLQPCLLLDLSTESDGKPGICVNEGFGDKSTRINHDSN